MNKPTGTRDSGGKRHVRNETGGGMEEHGERKDEGWQSRQGGAQQHGPRGHHGTDGPSGEDRGGRPGGTNTQGGLAGIAEASRESEERLHAAHAQGHTGPRDPGAGTDQPPREGGPLGPDPYHHPHLPEGAQDNDEKGTGARGFDRGVDASVIGTPYQGAKEEDPALATQPDE